MTELNLTVQDGVPGISVISLLLLTSLGSMCLCSTWSLPSSTWCVFWGGRLVLVELRDTDQIVIYSPSGGIRTLLYQCTIISFCISSLPLTFWYYPLELRGGLGGWKPFSYKQEMQDMERFLCSGRPYSDLLSFNPPFSLILLNLEGNRCWTRINSAEGLNFRGTHFQAQAGFSHGKAGFFDMESWVS